MITDYTVHQIIAFLEGDEDEENTKFWKAVETDERLRLEAEAFQLLIQTGRKKRQVRFSGNKRKLRSYMNRKKTRD